MNYDNQLIPKLRKSYGLTQSQLSHFSGVSLPFIQRIEAGTANPSIETITSILKCFHLNLSIQYPKANWEFLSAAGVPFMQNKIKPVKDILNLKTEIDKAVCELHMDDIEDKPRKLEALAAFLWAIRSFYPTLFKLYFETYDAFIEQNITAKAIKLRRIAGANLALYL
jgi:transcriptional regulator with XRE-family HTH domain